MADSKQTGVDYVQTHSSDLFKIGQTLAFTCMGSSSYDVLRQAPKGAAQADLQAGIAQILSKGGRFEFTLPKSFAGADSYLSALSHLMDDLNLNLSPSAYSMGALVNPRLLNIMLKPEVHETQTSFGPAYSITLQVAQDLPSGERSAALATWMANPYNLADVSISDAKTPNERSRLGQALLIKFFQNTEEGRQAALSGRPEAFRTFLANEFTQHYRSLTPNASAAASNAKADADALYAQMTASVSTSYALGVPGYFPPTDNFFDLSSKKGAFEYPELALSPFARTALGYKWILTYGAHFSTDPNTQPLVQMLRNFEGRYNIYVAQLLDADPIKRAQAQESLRNEVALIKSAILKDAAGQAATANMLLTCARLSANPLVRYLLASADYLNPKSSGQDERTGLTRSDQVFVRLLIDGLHVLDAGLSTTLRPTSDPFFKVSAGPDVSVGYSDYAYRFRSRTTQRQYLHDFRPDLGNLFESTQSSLSGVIESVFFGLGVNHTNTPDLKEAIPDFGKFTGEEFKGAPVTSDGPVMFWMLKGYQYYDSHGVLRTIRTQADLKGVTAEEDEGEEPDPSAKRTTDPVLDNLINIVKNYFLGGGMAECSIFSNSKVPSTGEWSSGVYMAQQELEAGCGMPLSDLLADPNVSGAKSMSDLPAKYRPAFQSVLDKLKDEFSYALSLRGLITTLGAIHFDPAHPDQSSAIKGAYTASDERFKTYGEMRNIFRMDENQTNVPLFEHLNARCFPPGLEPWRLDRQDRFSFLRDIYGYKSEDIPAGYAKYFIPLLQSNLLSIAVFVPQTYNAPPEFYAEGGKRYARLPPAAPPGCRTVDEAVHGENGMEKLVAEKNGNQKELDLLKAGLQHFSYRMDSQGRMEVVDDGAKGSLVYYYFDENAPAFDSKGRLIQNPKDGQWSQEYINRVWIGGQCRKNDVGKGRRYRVGKTDSRGNPMMVKVKDKKTGEVKEVQATRSAEKEDHPATLLLSGDRACNVQMGNDRRLEQRINGVQNGTGGWEIDVQGLIERRTGPSGGAK